MLHMLLYVLIIKKTEPTNDLWVFSETENAWYWLNGPKEPYGLGSSNYPPALFYPSHYVQDNTIWVFGGINPNNTVCT